MQVQRPQRQSQAVLAPVKQNCVQIISKLFNEKSENPFSRDRAWSQDSNESQGTPDLVYWLGERVILVQDISFVAQYPT